MSQGRLKLNGVVSGYLGLALCNPLLKPYEEAGEMLSSVNSHVNAGGQCICEMSEWGVFPPKYSR